MEANKQNYKPHQEKDIQLETLRESDEDRFIQLCWGAGYLSFIFDYFSQRESAKDLEKALKISRDLRGLPSDCLVDVFNKLEKAYLKQHASAVDWADRALGSVHGSVFEGAYDESFEATRMAEDYARSLEGLPKRAREFGLVRGEHGEYVLAEDVVPSQ